MPGGRGVACAWHVLFSPHFSFIRLLVGFAVADTHSPIAWLCWICRGSGCTAWVSAVSVRLTTVRLPGSLSFLSARPSISLILLTASGFPEEATFPSLVSCKIRKPTSLISFGDEHVTRAHSVGLHPRTYTGKLRCPLMTGFKMVTHGLQGSGCEASRAEGAADRP